MLLGIVPNVDYAFKHLLGRDATRPTLIEMVDHVLNSSPALRQLLRDCASRLHDIVAAHDLPGHEVAQEVAVTASDIFPMSPWQR